MILHSHAIATDFLNWTTRHLYDHTGTYIAVWLKTSIFFSRYFLQTYLVISSTLHSLFPSDLFRSILQTYLVKLLINSVKSQTTEWSTQKRKKYFVHRLAAILYFVHDFIDGSNARLPCPLVKPPELL